MVEQTQNNVVEDVEIRSEPVQDILTYIPHWLIHSGTTVIFIVLVFLLTGAYIIKYPETVKARVVLTTQAPPVRVFSRTSGKIDRLFVEDKQWVENGNYLAVLESAANLDHMLWLRQQLPVIRTFLVNPNWKDSVLNSWNRVVQLGDLQGAFSRFLIGIQGVQSLEDESPALLVSEIESQISDCQALHDRLEKQRELLSEELELAKKRFERSQNLFEKNLISEDDQNEAQSEFLIKRQNFQTAENGILNNRIKISEFRKSILTHEKQFRERQRETLAELAEAFKQLESDFAGWEHRFVLKAANPGRVSFFKFWVPQQYVKSGEEVLVIIPDQQELIGQIVLPQTGSGKVVPGQLVNIKFDSYPFEEYGMVAGKVEKVSAVTRDENYLITVVFPSGLMSSYGKVLDYKHDMAGSAAIVTEELRLLQRIFNQFRIMWSSYT